MPMELKYSKNLEYDFIPDILAIESAVYPSELRGSYDSISARYKKNTDSFLLVYEGAELAGYLCIFPVSSDFYTQLCTSGNFFDDNIRPENIINYGPENFLFLISTAILPKYQHGEAIRLLTEGLKTFLAGKEDSGLHIRAAATFAVSKAGARLAERIGFEAAEKLDNGDILYLCTGKQIRRFYKR